MSDNKVISRTDAPVKSARLIEALGGDLRSGMCPCVAHDDDNPSLHISEVNGKILFYCFAGCTQTAVLDAFRRRGLWPVPGTSTLSSFMAPRRSDADRRAYARQLLDDIRLNWGCAEASLLKKYFAGRGITGVPPTAMLATPWGSIRSQRRLLVPKEPAMVFGITDGDEIIGAHVTWLNRNFTAKRDEAPQRQFYGPINGGFIRLYDGELGSDQKLIIAEGVETAMAAAQIAGGLPAIAALSASNLPKITPPRAVEYIIAADNDPAGLAGARALASKLACGGRLVRLAVPPQPGSDWNDVLMEGA